MMMMTVHKRQWQRIYLTLRYPPFGRFLDSGVRDSFCFCLFSLGFFMDMSWRGGNEGVFNSPMNEHLLEGNGDAEIGT